MRCITCYHDNKTLFYKVTSYFRDLFVSVDEDVAGLRLSISGTSASFRSVVLCGSPCHRRRSSSAQLGSAGCGLFLPSYTPAPVCCVVFNLNYFVWIIYYNRLLRQTLLFKMVHFNCKTSFRNIFVTFPISETFLHHLSSV